MWISKVLQSFRYAFEGLKYAVATQRNLRIHFVVSLFILLLSLYLPLSRLEVLILFLCIAMVLFAELINTVMETIVDLVTEDYHPLAKIAKDVAAGAVLLTVGLVVLVGLDLFYPYLERLFIGLTGEPNNIQSLGVSGIIVFDFLLTLMIKGWLHHLEKKPLEPSMTVSVASCVAALIALMVGELIVALLVYLLLAILVVSRRRMQPHWAPIGFGVLIGSVVAILGIVLLGDMTF